MNFEDLLDPELRSFVSSMPVREGPFSVEQLRAGFNVMADTWRAATPERPTIATEDRLIPGPQGAPEVPVRLYRPRSPEAPLAALVWVHGGGFRFGRCDMDEGQCLRMADEHQCLVVSVEYRLAPEHPFPAGVDDVYAALTWLTKNALELGVDPLRIAIGGCSAGGGLAAGVALMARDKGGTPLAFQLLIYPTLDDTHTTPSSRTITDPRIWNRTMSIEAWGHYLGPAGAGPVSAYAAPSRAETLEGLPPTYMLIAEQDLLRDECIAYAQRLMQAGVTTEMQVFPGAFHGFYNVAPNAAISRRAIDSYIEALGRAVTSTRS